jgi:hypothetical protein
MIEVTAYRADRVSPDPVASFFTLNGAGFGEPPRHTFTQRCEAAAATGFAGIGLHIEDLARTREAGTNPGEMRAALRSSGLKLVEIEFVGGWALSTPASDADPPDPLRCPLAEVEDSPMRSAAGTAAVQLNGRPPRRCRLPETCSGATQTARRG